MYCIVVTLPLIKAAKTSPSPGNAKLLEPGDKWVEVQESIISRAFATKAKAERWAYRHGGIEEHDAQLVTRGGTREFDYLKRYGTFELRGISQYPARTRLLLVDLGARELPAEPAQKKAKQTGMNGTPDSTDMLIFASAANASNVEPGKRNSWRSLIRPPWWTGRPGLKR